MVVFRIENKEGRGPFFADSAESEVYIPDLNHTDGGLCLCEETMGSPPKETFGRLFAFTSLNSLHTALCEKVLEDLKSRGYSIVEYSIDSDVTVVFDEGRQVAFTKEQSMEEVMPKEFDSMDDMNWGCGCGPGPICGEPLELDEDVDDPTDDQVYYKCSDCDYTTRGETDNV